MQYSILKSPTDSVNPQIHQIVLASYQAHTAWLTFDLLVVIASGFILLFCLGLILTSGGDDAAVLFGIAFGLLSGLLLVGMILDHRINTKDVDEKCTFIQSWQQSPTAKATFVNKNAILSYYDSNSIMGVPATAPHSIVIPMDIANNLKSASILK